MLTNNSSHPGLTIIFSSLAVVIQYADNLLKCFSTSVSILISVILSVFLFDFQLSWGVTLGGAMVLAATYF